MTGQDGAEVGQRDTNTNTDTDRDRDRLAFAKRSNAGRYRKVPFDKLYRRLGDLYCWFVGADENRTTADRVTRDVRLRKKVYN